MVYEGDSILSITVRGDALKNLKLKLFVTTDEHPATIVSSSIAISEHPATN